MDGAGQDDGKTGNRRIVRSERFAVWRAHDRICLICGLLLDYRDLEVDHFLPKSLLKDPDRLRHVLSEFGLSEDFRINGYENWVPSHWWCNSGKRDVVLEPIPANQLILRKLASKAPEVARIKQRWESDPGRAEIFTRLVDAFHAQMISVDELVEWVRGFAHDPRSMGYSDVLVLDNGYAIEKSDIVRECVCSCERDACVGMPTKVWCYFTRDQSEWVVERGLFFRCYDEVIHCNRCLEMHKRGHVGRVDMCTPISG